MRKIRIAAIMGKKKTAAVAPLSQAHRQLGGGGEDFQAKPYSNVMKEKTDCRRKEPFEKDRVSEKRIM